MSDPTPRDRALISAIFAKMDVVAMACAAGVLMALALFLATAVLLMQETPAGYPVGPHLALLADYLPGFSVSWMGAVMALPYGFLIGAFLGAAVAILWNVTHYAALGAMLIKTAIFAD